MRAPTKALRIALLTIQWISDWLTGFGPGAPAASLVVVGRCPTKSNSFDRDGFGDPNLIVSRGTCGRMVKISDDAASSAPARLAGASECRKVRLESAITLVIRN